MKKYKQKKTLKREPEAIHQNPSKFEDRQEQAQQVGVVKPMISSNPLAKDALCGDIKPSMVT